MISSIFFAQFIQFPGREIKDQNFFLCCKQLNKASDQGIITSVTEYFSNSKFMIRIQRYCIHLLLIQWWFLLRYCWLWPKSSPEITSNYFFLHHVALVLKSVSKSKRLFWKEQ